MKWKENLLIFSKPSKCHDSKMEMNQMCLTVIRVHDARRLMMGFVKLEITFGLHNHVFFWVYDGRFESK